MREAATVSRTAAALLAVTLLSVGAWSQWTTTPLMQIRRTNDTLDTMLYSLYTPRVESGKKYPLVVSLHGNGGKGVASDPLGEDLFRLMTDTAVQNHTPCFMMGPACPQTARQPKWANTDWGKGSYSLAGVPISISMLLLGDAVHAVCTANPIDTNRIELAGGSMGGYGAWDAILRYPTLFASSTPLSGAGDPTHAADIAHVPLWAFAEASDALCPVTGSRDMIAAMRAAGSYPRYTEFNTGFYHLWSQIWEPYSEYYTPEQIPWMMRQVKSSSVPSKVTGLSATAAGSYLVNLTWQPANDAVGDPRRIHYFVFRNGTRIGPADLTLDSTHCADADSTLRENTTYSYTVTAVNDNSYTGPSSDAATVTTPADATPPVLLEAQDAGDSTHLILYFSERLNATSAANPANYASDHGLTIQQAVLQAGSRNVMLTVSPMTMHATYTFTVHDVKDQTGKNAIAANSTVAFTFDYLAGLRYDYYEFAAAPSSVDSLARMTPAATGVARSIGLDPYKQRNDNFGLRFTGLIQAPEAGRYLFGAAIDDAVKLYVDDSLILEGGNGYHRGSVQLTRGKHRIAVLFVQGCCGMALDVKWQGPNDATSRAIPGSFLFHNPDVAVAVASAAMLHSPARFLSVNSMRSGAMIKFTLPGAGQDRGVVSLCIYDLRGRLLRVLVNGPLAQGSHIATFDGRDDGGHALTHGNYIVRLRAGDAERCALTPSLR